MKIAFIGQKGIPAKLGGVERHVEELAKRLAEIGHEVFAYVRGNYTSKDLKEYAGVKLIHLPSIATKHLDAISHTFLATIHALFQGYDIIHYQAIGPSFLCWIPKLFLRRTKIVATFHCQDYYHKKWGWVARQSLRMGEYATCTVPHQTIVVSNTLKNYVKNNYEKNMEVIPNGCAIQENPGQDALGKMNLRKGGYVLSVSRLIRHKGVHYLIEAFKNLENKGLAQNIKLVIVGEGVYTDDYVKYLKELAANRENIIFTGVQTGTTLAQLFSNAGIFVHPSETEGLSITLLEAMGYGLPILASDIPENMEALSDNGIYFSASSVADLENKLDEILKNPEPARVRGEKARAYAAEKYDWKKIARQTEEVYKNVRLKRRPL